VDTLPSGNFSKSPQAVFLKAFNNGKFVRYEVPDFVFKGPGLPHVTHVFDVSDSYSHYLSPYYIAIFSQDPDFDWRKSSFKEAEVHAALKVANEKIASLVDRSRDARYERSDS